MQKLGLAQIIVLCGGMVACDADDCQETKCAPYTCARGTLQSLEHPDDYEMSPEDVLAATEGTWIGDGIVVEVRSDSGDARYGELRLSDGRAAEASDEARMDCAHIVVPAEVTVTSASDDGGLGDAETYRDIVVWGYEMAAEGASPEDGLERNFSGMPLGFPEAPGANLHFALDGTLWRIRGANDVEQIGMRHAE